MLRTAQYLVILLSSPVLVFLTANYEDDACKRRTRRNDRYIKYRMHDVLSVRAAATAVAAHLRII